MEHSLCSSVYVGTQRSSFYDCFMAASLQHLCLCQSVTDSIILSTLATVDHRALALSLVYNQPDVDISAKMFT